MNTRTHQAFAEVNEIISKPEFKEILKSPEAKRVITFLDKGMEAWAQRRKSNQKDNQK